MPTTVPGGGPLFILPYVEGTITVVCRFMSERKEDGRLRNDVLSVGVRRRRGAQMSLLVDRIDGGIGIGAITMAVAIQVEMRCTMRAGWC